jgi:hypothetical protein
VCLWAWVVFPFCVRTWECGHMPAVRVWVRERCHVRLSLCGHECGVLVCIFAGGGCWRVSRLQLPRPANPLQLHPCTPPPPLESPLSHTHNTTHSAPSLDPIHNGCLCVSRASRPVRVYVCMCARVHVGGRRAARTPVLPCCYRQPGASGTVPPGDHRGCGGEGGGRGVHLHPQSSQAIHGHGPPAIGRARARYYGIFMCGALPRTHAPLPPGRRTYTPHARTPRTLAPLSMPRVLPTSDTYNLTLTPPRNRARSSPHVAPCLHPRA